MSLKLTRVFMGNMHQKNRNDNVFDTDGLLDGLDGVNVTLIPESKDYLSFENEENHVGVVSNLSINNGCLFGDVEINTKHPKMNFLIELSESDLFSVVEFRPRMSSTTLKCVGNWGCIVGGLSIVAIAILPKGNGW